MNNQESLVQQQRVIEKKKVQSEWLKGMSKQEYEDFINNAFYLEKRLSIFAQLKQNSTQMKQLESEITNLQNIKYNREYMKNANIISNGIDQAFQASAEQIKYFEMEKIGKKGGSLIKRSVFFNGEQIFQAKNLNSKNPIQRLLDFPQSFVFESFDTFSNLNAQSKLKELPWTKSVVQKQSRLLFFYQNRVKGMAIYFDTVEQGIAVRDYLISIRAIKNQQQINSTLQKLSKIFYLRAASSFREVLKENFDYRCKIRMQSLQSNKLLQKLDQIVVKCFMNTASMITQFKRAQFIYEQEKQIQLLKQQQENEQLIIEQQKEQQQFFSTEEILSKQVQGSHSQSDIVSHNNKSNLSANQNQNDFSQQKKQMWALSQNQFIQQFDNLVLIQFVDYWKQVAAKKKQEIENQKKTIIFTFQEIELESKIDLIKPILSIQLIKENENFDLRIVNDQQLSSNNEGVYFQTELQCRVKNKLNPSTISWYLFNIDSTVQQSQPHYKGPSENLILPFQNTIQIRDSQMSYELKINNYDLNDSLVIELRDLGSADKQQKAKGKFYFSELCVDQNIGKRNWINLDFRNFLFSQDTQLPIIKLDSFISPSLIPNAKNFDDIVTYYVDYNLPFIDPIYGESIQFPNLTKKKVKIMQKTLEKKEIINDELKYLKFIDQREIFILKKIKKNAILKFNKQISLENARLKKNIDLIVQLQELLLKVREANTPSNASLAYPPSSPTRRLNHDDDRDDFGSVTLSRLLSERKAWRQKCPQAYTLLEEICKEGIPNYMRMQIWKSLSRVQELKIISERAWSQFTSIRNYYSHNQVSLKTAAEEDIQLTLYEHFLRGSTENYLVLQQQIKDDITYYLKKHTNRSVHSLTMSQIENIMNAFIFWSIILGSDSNSSHFSYINYSADLIEICDKIGIYYISQSLAYDEIQIDQDFIEFKKEEEVFWLLVSIVYFILKNYYRFNPNIQHEGMRGSFKIKDYMPNMFPPLQSNKLVGLKAELLLLKILIKENIPDLAMKLNEVGLPTEYYFSSHLLTMFSSLFSTDIVFRIWDILLFESALEHEGHTNILMLSVIITLLQHSKEDIIKCSRASEVEMVLKIHGFFVMSSSEFIKQVLENKKKFVEKLAFYLNILLNLEDELKVHYNSRLLLNQQINCYVNAKSEFDKCDSIQIDETYKIVEKLKERDNKRKYAMDQKSGEDPDDSLEIPDQFDDENEREMYQLADNKFLNHMINKAAQQQSNLNTLGGAFMTQPDLQQMNTMNLTNQTTMNNNFNLDFFNQYQDVDQYQVQQQQQASQLTIFRKPQLRRIFLYFHKLKLFWAENTEIVMEINYEQQFKQDIKIIVDTCIFLNHYEEFQYIEGYDKIAIRLYEDPKSINTELQGQKRLIKECIINLNYYYPDYLIKTTLLLDDICAFRQAIHNYTTSEIDISVILLSDKYTQQIQSPFPINNLPLYTIRNQVSLALQNHPTKLVNYLFKIDDKTKTTDFNTLRQFFRSDIQNIPIFSAISHYSLESSQKINWRLNSETTFEVMKMFLKISLNDGSISGLSNVNFLRTVFDFHVINNPNKTFYFMDFIVSIILFSTSTFKQKLYLFFDLLQVFDSQRDQEQLVHMNTVLEFVKYIYDMFMIYIPDNQIYDMVEYAILGSVNRVVKAELTVRDNDNIVIDVTKEIINMQNQNNLAVKCKDIFLGGSNSLSILKNLLDEKIKNQIEGLNNSQYMLNIKYRVEGILTKFTCLIDKDWKVTKRIILDKRPDLPYKKPDDSQPIQQIMHNNENLISLSNQNLKVSKKQFIEIMEKLPILRYLVNFQNSITQVTNVSKTLNQDQFALPTRKILINQIQVNFTVMVNSKVIAVINVIDDKQKRLFNSRLNQRLKFINKPDVEDPILGTGPLMQKRQSNLKQSLNQSVELVQQHTLESLKEDYQHLIIELKQKRQNIQYSNNRSEINQFIYNSTDLSQVVNLKTSLSFYSGMDIVILIIQNLILQETINQLDVGQTFLLALDFEKTIIELFLQNQKLTEYQEKSIYDYALLNSNQTLNFKMVCQYNIPSKLNIQIQQKINQEIFNIDQEFNQLAKFRYSEFLSEYMPCQIVMKQTSCKKVKLMYSDISNFIVRFKHLQKNLFLKKPSDVLIITKIDLNELEEKQSQEYNEEYIHQ
ncbi:hypothetical protein TTHERM_00476560 (macronuclear) [Tetrahymena thermophila SB210]|uniref:Rab-GAP TBC domain-containing protein n=1 Tax=Tetrahymena thermophila (strain SB210) TaxID=312017 RepID=I7M1L4_TETTS|nr:hypothetical protein TTHERM_00476560 [Tetrahymena thermophila SB210]EAR97119.2 hypothetical protein TTHERM_00476560 [Tetrahymena thermophila SB210]|eukprot:XP_001017364.2 hypothetical protein TTHERM_00476560 [Tetrahymena thermophila SB210]